jgi:hypothetical protein
MKAIGTLPSVHHLTLLPRAAAPPRRDRTLRKRRLFSSLAVSHRWGNSHEHGNMPDLVSLVYYCHFLRQWCIYFRESIP